MSEIHRFRPELQPRHEDPAKRSYIARTTGALALAGALFVSTDSNIRAAQAAELTAAAEVIATGYADCHIDSDTPPVLDTNPHIDPLPRTSLGIALEFTLSPAGKEARDAYTRDLTWDNHQDLFGQVQVGEYALAVSHDRFDDGHSETPPGSGNFELSGVISPQNHPDGTRIQLGLNQAVYWGNSTQTNKTTGTVYCGTLIRQNNTWVVEASKGTLPPTTTSEIPMR